MKDKSRIEILPRARRDPRFPPRKDSRRSWGRCYSVNVSVSAVSTACAFSSSWRSPVPWRRASCVAWVFQSPEGCQGQDSLALTARTKPSPCLSTNFWAWFTPLSSHTSISNFHVFAVADTVIHRAISTFFFYLNNSSLRGTKARIVYSESFFELISACRGRKERKHV